MHPSETLVAMVPPDKDLYVLVEKGQVTDGLILSHHLNRFPAQTYNAFRDVSTTSHFHSLDPAAAMVFRRRLLRWYDRHQRDLPWRASREPYRVWLSEIMLQQTRVAAVVEYYQRFVEQFPTLDTLAASRTASVLAAWSGLGYYRRARMMHAAAKKIVREHRGEFPRTSQELRVLPGIGRYTAAAVASIAFGETIAAVDANVERVLQRVQGRRVGAKELGHVAQSLLSRSRPGDFNQGMMELGATVCLPREPKCLMCPVVELCATRGSLEKTKKEKRQRRQIHYALDCRKDSVFLVQRPRLASLMPGLWELPETSSPLATGKPHFTVRHSITVTDYTVGIVRQPAPGGSKGRWVPLSRLSRMPLTGLARKVLRLAKLI
jgi:A/G-specific adenine glycosylase